MDAEGTNLLICEVGFDAAKGDLVCLSSSSILGYTVFFCKTLSSLLGDSYKIEASVGP